MENFAISVKFKAVLDDLTYLQEKACLAFLSDEISQACFVDFIGAMGQLHVIHTLYSMDKITAELADKLIDTFNASHAPTVSYLLHNNDQNDQ